MGEDKSFIDQQGWQLVLVHMDAEDDLPNLEKLGLGDVAQVADPQCELYRSFGLHKGSLWQLFGPRVWIRGFQAAIKGNRVGSLQGDGLQLAGMFLVEDGNIVRSNTATHAGKLQFAQALS